MTREISRYREEASKLEKENAVLNREFNDTHQDVETLDSKFTDIRTEYDLL